MIRRQSTARSSPFSPSAVRLLRDWEVLCVQIGDRRAGGTGDLQATDYLLERFAKAGLAAHREPVPCVTLRTESRSDVSGLIGKQWVPCPARELVGSASTPSGRTVDGEVTWIEMPEAAHRITPRYCRGKVVLLFGPMPVDAQQYRRLVHAGPAAVLHVDDRLPFAWPKSDALYPHWTTLHGAVPTVAIPYQVAWQWKIAGVKRARVRVAAIHRAATSANVVATLPGGDHRLPRIMVTAHHDTQPATVGADDNASGVVCLLELARSLAARPAMRRTVDFVSFGAEEQLSVGSTHYVRSHPAELGRVGLVINLDSVASPLGHTYLYHSGQKGLAAAMHSQLRNGGLDLEVAGGVSPFADHFPFSACGVPSVWIYRANVNGGHRWQHHSQHDSLEQVSVDQAAAVTKAVGAAVVNLAGMSEWPWRRALPPDVRKLTTRLALEMYGLLKLRRSRS